MSVIQIPSELLELRKSVKDFIDREIRPIEEPYLQEFRETGEIANAEVERKKIRKKSADVGFYGMHMPEEVGGMGLSYLGQVLVEEEISR